MKTNAINSLRELQLQMPAIFEKYGNDNNFTQIALANPIAALEKIGMEFTDRAKDEIETYARFGKEGAKQISELRANINDTAGSFVDLNAPYQIAEIIISTGDFNVSKSSEQAKKGAGAGSSSVDKAALIKALESSPKKENNLWQDDLAQFSSMHPVLPLILQYRKLDAESPRFADKKNISAIQEKLNKGPLKNVVFTLTCDPVKLKK
ncbi:MAG TPA: hypothetical protein DCO83_02790 [Mucilaginibacter sp.]|jgi:DNA polymerase I-like protein with 3'-5' exonuclease and polymerase domains|nr:hypothetical protein [Mucilaginibacter sp.]